MGQHHPDRAAADHDPLQAGPVGRRAADQGRLGLGRAAANARLLQRLGCLGGHQRRWGAGGRRRAAGAGPRAASAGGDEQCHHGDAAHDPAPSPALVGGLGLKVHAVAAPLAARSHARVPGPRPSNVTPRPDTQGFKGPWVSGRWVITLWIAAGGLRSYHPPREAFAYAKVRKRVHAARQYSWSRPPSRSRR